MDLVVSELSDKCNLCDYVPSKPSKKTIRIHKESVHDGLKHQCPHCEREWTTRSNMKKHIESRHSGTKKQCSRCNFTTAVTANLKYHERKEHLTVQFHCRGEGCGMSFPLQSNRKTHEMRIHAEKTFECLACVEKFPSIYFLKHHIRIKHCGLFCDACSCQLKDKDYFAEHNKQHHDGDHILCDCGTKCFSELNFKWHIKKCQRKRQIKENREQNQELLVCDECGYRPKAPSLYAVKIHKESMHSGIKHICPNCLKPFTTRSNLTKHIANVHEGRRFECGICKYSAKCHRSIKKHKKMEHPWVLFYCEHSPCSYSTVTESHLNYHLKKEHDQTNNEEVLPPDSNNEVELTDEKPTKDPLEVFPEVQCPLCGKGFNEKDGLKEHLIGKECSTIKERNQKGDVEELDSDTDMEITERYQGHIDPTTG